MRAQIAVVPSPKKRAKERPASDLALLKFILSLFREFRAGMPIFKRRAAMREEAHRKVDAWFDTKIAGR